MARLSWPLGKSSETSRLNEAEREENRNKAAVVLELLWRTDNHWGNNADVHDSLELNDYVRWWTAVVCAIWRFRVADIHSWYTTQDTACRRTTPSTSHQRSSLEYIIMSLTVPPGILPHPHNPCPLSSHHPLRRRKATAQIWQPVQPFVQNSCSISCSVLLLTALLSNLTIYSPFRLQTTDIMVTQPSTCLRLSDNTTGTITWWWRLPEEFRRNPITTCSINSQ